MHRPSLFRNLISLVFLGILLLRPVAGAADQVLVAAASSLRFALDELAGDFAAETGQRITLVYGSSGNFARQIRQGAPFGIFLSADEAYVRDLAADGLTRDDGVLYALGRLVLAVPPGADLRAEGDLSDVMPAIADGRLRRFAIANPDHAPYGARARETLQALGLWEAVQPKLVLGENVGQAAQFVFSGNAQGGILAYSLVLSPDVPQGITYALIPDDLHAPLGQRMVLLKGADAQAEAFYAYLQTPEAAAVFARYGFDVPEAGE